MSALDFLNDLRKKKIKVWAEGNKLRYSAPKGALSQELRHELVRLKPEILAFLGAGKIEAPPIQPASKIGNPPPILCPKASMVFGSTGTRQLSV